MKAVILARVSTEDQMQEGYSIPAQLARSREYCQRKGLEVAKEFQFDESSTRDQRVKFELVINEIKKSHEPVALIAETIDRVQRSFKESILLLELIKTGKAEIHFIRENLIIHKDSNSSEFLRWDMGVMFARGYVLQLSDNVKRTFDLKRKRGEWPGKPPIGYINTKDESGNRIIIPDTEKSHFIPRAYEEYIKGTSIKLLAKKLGKEGFTGYRGKPITSGMIFNIIKNPFYYGVAISKGKEYQHKYEPLISRYTYLKAQEIRQSWKKKPFKYAGKPFVLRGLMKCKKCGSTISPEIKKGKYVYYSCTNSRGICERIYINEAELLKPIYKSLKAIQLPQDKIDYLVTELRKSNENKNEYRRQAVGNLDQEDLSVQIRIDRLMDLLLDGSITKDEYDKKHKSLRERQYEIAMQREEHIKADEQYHITASTVLNLAKRAVEIFESSEVPEKRQFLNYLLQNCLLDGKNLEFSLRNPFNYLVSANEFTALLPG